MSIELIASICPAVEKASESYQEMPEEVYLIWIGLWNPHKQGLPNQHNSLPSNKLWDTIIYLGETESNYYSIRIKVCWLDESEAELQRI